MESGALWQSQLLQLVCCDQATEQRPQHHTFATVPICMPTAFESAL